jgi:TolA-binding protein
LHQLTDSVSDKSFAPGAWMKTGFIYQQTNEDNKAIEAYKRVVIDYPASEDRMPALDALKSLYIEINQPAAYTQMLRDNNLPSADSSSIDSTYYAAAEAQFAAGKMENARQGFTSYLEQYPNGIFAIKAHYYKAESNFQLKKYKDARQDYEIILAGPWNDFYENSARHAAVIAYDEKDYPAAFDYYQKLKESTSGKQMKELAYTGLMKSGYYSGKYSETSLYADTVLAMPGVSAELVNEATYFKARSLQEMGNADDATTLYEQLSSNKNGEIAAESRYRISEILFKQDKLKDAEEAANEAIRLSSGYDYWIVRSYLLLSDILIKQKDYFNAKATLQSVVKHTKIAELKTEATKKLEEVKALEKKQSKLSEE